ncbi:DUF421 domain-containing protein [Bacillus sp. Marseille-Q3570]|uniref:DUF421 domain-containing protein n=1 Tax=Bacillus sp. Marseille-Q3570 TaxID=2963522 RepID=UPI0021B7BF8D|nr:DUF421 domain-containing protein [Bacillus sp. Marseille-Q3570]
MQVLSTATELSVGFLALFLMTKVLGKVSFAQITPFDFISAIVLGELVGNAIYDKEVKLTSILFAIFLWGVLMYFFEWLTQKFRGTRKFLEGSPSIVIRDGMCDKKEMKKNKLDVNQLQNLLRQKDIFSVREVAYAIVETDGSVSVMRKPEYETPTLSDMGLPQKPVYLPFTFINDGKVDWENLKKAGFDETWLNKTLHKHQIDHYEDIFYMEWKQDEGVHINKMPPTADQK